MSLGLVAQHTGEKQVSVSTREFPNISRLLNQYAEENLDRSFLWTTVTLNDDFASARHRDGGNSGLSYILSVGDHQAGRLWVWPRDCGHGSL